MTVTAPQLELHIPPTDRLNRRDGNLIAILVFCTFALYLRVWHFEFITFDDPLYVSSNVHIEQGLSIASLKWAMHAAPNGNWHPLTTLVELATSSIFGMRSGAFHGVNMLLHTLNVGLLYLFFRRSTGRAWPAFFTSLLWGLHPQRVESVAWVSELKDVLCGAFWIGCMLAYVHYARRRTLAGLAIVYLLQTLSLLSKPMAVTLPPALLLLDYWPLGRPKTAAARVSVPIGNELTAHFSDPLPVLNYRPLKSSDSTARWWTMRVLEKLPMALLCFGDVFMQQNTISFSTVAIPLRLRIQNGLVSYVLYLRDAVYPNRLAILYPHPVMFRAQFQASVTIPWMHVYASAAVLLLISIAVCLRAKAQPYLLVGWCWFLGTMVPVIGLVQVGEQARADRFTYFPSIGVTMALVWLAGDLIAVRIVWRETVAGVGAVVALLLALVSNHDIKFWNNTGNLFGHLLAVQPDNYLALAMECDQVRGEGHLQEAEEIGRRAIGISPASPRAHNSYGIALYLDGALARAGDQFQIATKLDPDNADYWDSLGRVRDAQADQLAGKDEDLANKYRMVAAANFRNAIKAFSDEVIARDHLAYLLARTGKIDEAIQLWEQAVEIEPHYAQAHGDLADALRVKKDIPGAIAHYQAAIALGSKKPAWETWLAWLVAINPQFTPQDVQPMVAIAKDACDQTQNRDVPALEAYAACLARVGIFDDAVAAAKQAVAQANAAHDPALAKDVEKRLALYEQQQIYLDVVATTRPHDQATTAP